MPANKSKPSPNSKPDKSKKPSELRDDELRKVSGGLASTGGTSVDAVKCISQT